MPAFATGRAVDLVGDGTWELAACRGCRWFTSRGLRLRCGAVWPVSPRCLPAWDGVQDQSESTKKSVASPPRCLSAWSGVHGDRRSDRDDVWSGTWPHAGKQRGGRRVRGAGRCLALNTAPRWQAAWWPESGKLLRPPLLGAPPSSAATAGTAKNKTIERYRQRTYSERFIVIPSTVILDRPREQRVSEQLQPGFSIRVSTG